MRMEITPQNKVYLLSKLFGSNVTDFVFDYNGYNLNISSLANYDRTIIFDLVENRLYLSDKRKDFLITTAFSHSKHKFVQWPLFKRLLP